MSAYRGTAEGRDRARAIAAVVAVHLALALLIVSGLGVRSVRQAVDRLATIDIRMVPPPQPSVAQRQPAPRPRVAEAPAPPARKADPTPMVAPATRLPSPNPIVAAQVAGTGASASSGAAAYGNGSGTGGVGNGTGSDNGGTPDYSRFTPAQLIANIPSFEYRRLAATGIPSGQIGVMIRVEPDGRLAYCRIARSSGDPGIDALVCQLTLRYVRFEPARDPDGRPVAQDVTYFPSWRRR